MKNEPDCDDKDDRGTPAELFRHLNARFRFTVDVCASRHNAKLDRFFSKDTDGLAQSWRGERVWCNPPYSEIGKWVHKATTGGAEIVVMLIPANRTEQPFWQSMIEPFRGRGRISVEFLPGRINFAFPPGDLRVGRSPPFSSCLIIILGADAIPPWARQGSLFA